MELNNPAYTLSIEDIGKQLETDLSSGLSFVEASRRITEYGENKLTTDVGTSAFRVFMKQILNAMCVVLILAAALSFGTTDWIEGGVISAVIFLNVFVGFIQEYKAEKTMESLRSLSSPMAHVLRDGSVEQIASKDVAVGDVVVLRTGDVVPADIRLTESHSFETDEALLTGESLPVVKDARETFSMEEDVPVGDRINLAYSSSIVTKGRAKGICYATGMHTELGAIAAGLKNASKRQFTPPSKDQPHYRKQLLKFRLRKIRYYIARGLGLNVGTPLQQKMTVMAYALFIIAIILAIVVMAAHKFDVTNEVSIYAISLGIAIIPESLIAVLAITMAIGQKTMAKRKVIVRKLEALEALGGVTDICSDKTGTITQGKMIVRRLWLPSVGSLVIDAPNALDPESADVSVQRHKYEKGVFNEEAENSGFEETDFGSLKDDLLPVVEITSLCNNSVVQKPDTKGDEWSAKGEPTEIALHVFSWRFGLGKDVLLPNYTLLKECPFDSELKRMAVVYEKPDGQRMVLVKGAVERVIERCATIMGSPFEKQDEDVVSSYVELLAAQGLRVLALARKNFDEDVSDWERLDRDTIESKLDFVGLVGIYDPPRAESKNSVALCHKAGIRVHMLTGDHPETARAIARDVGIIPFRNDDIRDIKWMVMTGTQFDSMSHEEIDNLPALPLVIARCAPQTKVKMIEAIHRRKGFAAMTGDGVNDSPSLKKANVGIAMGQNGSDVAKDSSDIVLTDDNFSSIVNAIEEGRRIFDNIMKFVLHLLISNVGEVILLIVGLAFRDHVSLSVFPMSPVEVLWANMITSSFPSMGLGMEEATPDIMNRLPHDNNVGVFTTSLICDMLVYGSALGVLALMTWVVIMYGFGTGNLSYDCNAYYHEGCLDVFRARAAVFSVVTFTILIMACEVKNFNNSVFNLRGEPWSEWSFKKFWKNLTRNKFLAYSVMGGAASIFPTIYIPVINTNVFKHKPIGWEWGVVFVAAILFLLFVELWKFFRRWVLGVSSESPAFKRALSRTITNETRLTEKDLERRLFHHVQNADDLPNRNDGDV
ncbi:P-type ATPase [Schizosaccharomyces japonicus yFS275]|uniref:P-type Na(+) transporter n=1 Tax=Schizosaccharomyces japonicus (strain yFS275 / FY16936) TaxID=402676 RepID=B6K638_SCHJY|nr:P-type ATPase [Schizosaccharomyces japonicus yFS275]EEB08992.1 P-type ATPase [Schizosaccharomyces japonicus yFS275]